MQPRPSILASVLLATFHAFGVAATIPVSEDSFGYRAKLTAPANAAPALPVDGFHHAFLYFNLTEVPPASSVRYARLRLFFPNVVRAGSGLGLHFVTGTWDESVASVEPAFDPSLLTTVGPNGLVKRRFISVDVTATVQGWINFPSSNEGFAVTAVPGASAKLTAGVFLGAKEGSGSGYPAELEVELNPARTPGGIGATELAPDLNLAGVTSGTFSGNGSALTSLNASNITGQFTNAQLANSSLTVNLGTGLGGDSSVALGGTLNLSNTGVLSLSASGGITVSAASGDIALGSNATTSNLPNTIIRRDANGSFAAGAILANSFSGNGAGLTNLSAANIAGQVNSAQLAANLSLGGITTGAFSGDGAGLTNVTAANGVMASSLANANGSFMEFVRIGSPGNASDSTGFGAVGATYLIGKYEVTNAQYARFLNAVASSDPNALYNDQMGTSDYGGISRLGQAGTFTYTVRPNMGNKPVNFVGYFDAARFCNWIHNGMPTGPQGNNTTESGAYQISGTAPNWTVGPRLSGAKAFVPNENEWYKAAYFDPEKGSVGGYWLYPTRSNSVPAVASADAAGNINNPSSNIANYSFGVAWNGQVGNVATVGSGGPGCESAFGACDMGGNVWEWLETITTGTMHQLRNGSWNAGENFMRSTFRDSDGDLPNLEKEDYGFRIAKP